MNHLLRDLAPIADGAWGQIEEEATRTLKHLLAGRRLVDFSGPHGWEESDVDLGRVTEIDGLPGVQMAARRVLPLVEVRAPFSLDRAELAAAARGATDVDLAPVVEAARAAAAAEDTLVFNGHRAAGSPGLIPESPHTPISIGDDYGRYPSLVARAVAVLRNADIDGPYAIALGPRCYTGVVESTEHGGYPVFEHLRHILGGPTVWAPAVDGAVVLSQRGGDYELTVGQDLSIGYAGADPARVELYLEESLAFRINSPEAAVALTHQG